MEKIVTPSIHSLVTSFELCSSPNAPYRIHGKAGQARIEAGNCLVNDTILLQEERGHLLYIKREIKILRDHKIQSKY
jgi:hypothetical protein